VSGKSPAFQFYVQDYLASSRVAEMTLEEEGVYIRLLCYCWSVGSIPADPERCAKLAGKGCSIETATNVQRSFNEHPTDAQRLVHDRLELERERQQTRREQASEAGKKSAARRAKTPKTPAKTRDLNDRSTDVQRKVNTSSSSSSSSSSVYIYQGPEFSGCEEIVIPPKMQTEEVQKAFTHWVRHLESKDPLKVPPRNSPQLEAFWFQWSKRGPERFCEAVYHSSGNGYLNLHEPPALTHSGNGKTNGKQRTSIDDIEL
jgi:uncharacterized protein YdaU (DUF1376 family)